MRGYARYIVLLATGMLAACGPAATESEDLFSGVQDIYHVIEQGTDSFIRPRGQEFSSLRFPFEQYGPAELFSENATNDFSFGLGLNEGEYISLTFSGLTVCEIEVSPPHSSYLISPASVDVWVNHWFIGNFPLSSPIPIDRPVNQIDFQFRVEDGWNTMDLSLNNQKKHWQHTARKLGRLHNSRPLGIRSIIFRSCLGEVLPVAPIPYLNSAVQVHGSGDPLDVYFLSRNIPETGMRFTPGEAERRLIFQSSQYIPWLGIRWQQDRHPGGMMIFNTALPRGERIFDTLRDPNPTIFLWDSLVTKAISFGLWAADNRKQPVTLSNFQVWSGNKWKLIVPDSLPTWEKRRQDSLKSTPISPLLHLPLRFKTEEIKLQTDTLLIEEPEDALGLITLESIERIWRIQVRSNGSISIYHQSNHVRESGKSVHTIGFFQGRWFYEPRTGNLLGLTGSYSRNEMQGESTMRHFELVNGMAKIESNFLYLPAPFEQIIPIRR